LQFFEELAVFLGERVLRLHARQHFESAPVIFLRSLQVRFALRPIWRPGQFFGRLTDITMDKREFPSGAETLPVCSSTKVPVRGSSNKIASRPIRIWSSWNRLDFDRLIRLLHGLSSFAVFFELFDILANLFQQFAVHLGQSLLRLGS
jgi:hypothetical protein